MKTLDRGFELLEHIIESQDPVAIRALLTLTGLDRSTVYRYLNVLIERRYIQPDPLKRGFVPGCRVLELTGSILKSFGVRDAARPYLLSLANDLSMTAHLAIRDVDQILYLDKVETQRSLPIISRIGSRAPLYCTSLGKVFLAFEDPMVVNELLPHLAMESKTENTITETDHLMAELKDVRDRGYAVDDEENEMGIFCMAAPVFGVTGAIDAAISVTGLKRQFGDRERTARMLQRATAEISASLGGPAMSCRK